MCLWKFASLFAVDKTDNHGDVRVIALHPPPSQHVCALLRRVSKDPIMPRRRVPVFKPRLVMPLATPLHVVRFCAWCRIVLFLYAFTPSDDAKHPSTMLENTCEAFNSYAPHKRDLLKPLTPDTTLHVSTCYAILCTMLRYLLSEMYHQVHGH